MTPKWCYRLVLISLVLRVMGGCWVAFVALEYTRYYVWPSALVLVCARTEPARLQDSDPAVLLAVVASIPEVLNDLAELDLLRVLTGSPQFAIQAFLFPFLGARISAGRI